MNTAWDLWIVSCGMIALTLVTLFMSMLYLEEETEEREKDKAE